jgi:flagellar basal body-associated protein FliL
MSVNDKTPGPVSSSKQRARRLKIIGVIILLLGIAGAGIVYWIGTRSPDLSGDLSMVGYNKPAERQMEILYGKQGELIEDWSNDLKQPGTQAIIIVVAAALVAGGCFYFARLLDYDNKIR